MKRIAWIVLAMAACGKPAPPPVAPPPVVTPPAVPKPVAKPDDAELIKRVEAALASNGGAWADLEKELTTAIEARGTSALLAARASLRERIANDDGALADFAQAVRLAGDQPGLRRRRMALLEKKQLWAELVADLDVLMGLDAAEPGLRLKRAKARQRCEEYSRAVEDYTVLLEADPTADELRRARAMCAVEAGQRELALADITNLILRKATADLYSLRASYQERERGKEKAKEDYGKALELDPKHVRGLCGLSELLTREDPPKSVELANRAVAVDPKNARALFLRGAARIFAKDRDKGVEDLRAAMEMEPALKDQALTLINTPLETLLKDRQKDFFSEHPHEHPDHKDHKDHK